MWIKSLCFVVAIVLPVTVMATGSNDGAAHAPAAWASMDANNDGVLTRDEVATTPWADRFDKIDRNSDGKATTEEFSAYMKAMNESQDNDSQGGS